MQKFTKLKRVVKIAKEKGKCKVNKTFSLVTKKYQPDIDIEVNQTSIYDILTNQERSRLILDDGFWFKEPENKYIFCGHTALCLYMHLKYAGLDDVLKQLYGKRELAAEEKEELRKIKC